MATAHDVDDRLAEGSPAVDDFTVYVRACAQVGHVLPELARPADEYSREEGLQLTALDADVAALTAMGAATSDAVRRQHDVTAALSGGWSGAGAAAALEFLQRHQQSAAAVATRIQDAAAALTDLRDELWRAVDAKVAATLVVDEGTAGQRAAWLAAAHTVIGGAGDRSVASELVEQQVQPFVDNHIRADWLPAMRAGSSAAAAAYDAALARLRAGPQAVFELPGVLGPQWQAAAESHDTGRPEPKAIAPASVGASASFVPAAAAAPLGLPPTAPAVPESPPVAPAPAAPAPLSDLGGGAPGLGGGAPGLGGLGLSGLGQQLSDLIGGLVGASAEATPELPDPDVPDLTDVDDPDTGDDEPDVDDPDDDNPDDGSEDDTDDDNPDDGSEDDTDEHEDEDEEDEPADVDVADDTVQSNAEPSAPTDPPQEPTPVTSNPPPAPLPPPPGAEPEPEPKTPCEIAADELPQVGE